MAINPTSADVNRVLQRSDVKAARSERREERAAARAARRAARSGGSDSSSDAAAAQVSTPAQSASSGTPTSATKAPDAPKSFRGSTKDSNVVHFAVQGGVSGNAISVFGSGEGPKAIHPETKTTSSTEQNTASQAQTSSVDKVA